MAQRTTSASAGPAANSASAFRASGEPISTNADTARARRLGFDNNPETWHRVVMADIEIELISSRKSKTLEKPSQVEFACFPCIYA
jgi:hypothetical protein